MAQQRLSQHNVVGVLGTFPAATEVLEALIDAGFDVKGELTLLGPEHEMRPASDHVKEARGDAMTGIGAGVVGGSVAGGAAGAALVGLVTAAVVALPGVAVAGFGATATVLAGVATGATGGSTVGALLGVEAAGRRATMWQQTLSPLLRRVHDEHVVLVGVHVDEEDRADEAKRLLRESGAEVVLLDGDIEYQPEQTRAYVGDRIPSGSAEAPGAAHEGMEVEPNQR